MGDNGELKKEEPKLEGQAGIPQPVKLIIELSPDGKLSLTGPTANKILCYGMIEMARELLTGMTIINELNQPKIHKGSMMDFVRGRRV